MSRLLPVGRALFALAVVGFGVLCLIYVDFIHQLQPVDLLLPSSTLLYTVLALLTGVFLIAAGPAIVTGIKAYPVAVTLTGLFVAGIVLLQVPSAFIDPELLRSPWWVRTFETLALTGAAVTIVGLTSRPERSQWIRLGRVFLGVSLPVFGVLHFVYAENVASLVPALYPWPLLWAYLTGTGNIAAGVAILTGVLSRLAAILAGAMYATYALTLHIPRSAMRYVPDLFSGDPATFQSARGGLTSTFVAIGMWGTAWIVAGGLAGQGSSGQESGDAETPERTPEAAKATT